MASFIFVVSSVFAGSKYMQFNIVKNINEKFVEQMEEISSSTKFKWNENAQLLNNRIKQLSMKLETIQSSENQLIQEKIESEKSLLQKNYEKAILEKFNEIGEEMDKYKDELNGKIKATESILENLDGRLNNFHEINKNQKDLEAISQLLIEDNIDCRFDNCYSLKVLRSEFKCIFPLLRKYYILSYTDFSTLKYFLSGIIIKLTFEDASIENFDLLSELNSAIQKGDLHNALFLFNSLKGWPRLLLKDWAEKCRLRLEFIQKVKSQLYLNKL